MSGSAKIVLVASGSSPDRAIAIERLLASAASRAGWSDRLDLRLGGTGGGAGRISDAGLAALEGCGIDAAGAVCPDLERRPVLLEGAKFVVCDRGDVADALIDWDEAGEAQFVVMDEVDGKPEAEDEEDAPIGEEVRRYEGSIEEVLRRLVAAAPPG